MRAALPLIPLLTVVSLLSNLADVSGNAILEANATGKLGGSSVVTCTVTPFDVEVGWTFEGEEISFNDTKYVIDKGTPIIDENSRTEILTFNNTAVADHGTFRCFIIGSDNVGKDVSLNLSIPTKVRYRDKSPIYVRIGDVLRLNCTFEGFKLTTVEWRMAKNMSVSLNKEDMLSTVINDTLINGTLTLSDIGKKDNGTYRCGCQSSLSGNIIMASIDVLVLDKPQINLDFVKAVGANKIFLNWTLNDWNSPITRYGLQYRKNGSDTWTYFNFPIPLNKLSFIMTNLEPSTLYQIKIDAKNAEGSSLPDMSKHLIQTFAEDPHFIPNITLKGHTSSSISISWDPPPSDQAEFVHYYELSIKEQNSDANEKQAIHSEKEYMFENLSPYTTYVFKARACSELTNECGNWSVSLNGTTMDGESSPPVNVTHLCKYDNISGENFIYVAWEPPVYPRGIVIRYTVEVTGHASFMNRHGRIENATWGPKVRNAANNYARFDTIPANTNYTIKISAVTRIKRNGKSASVHCSTPPSVPPKESMKDIRWMRVRENNGRWMFKLTIPRITERNGGICCYRIYLVKMKHHQMLADMPSPEYLTVSSYKMVHDGNGGAYIADVFTSNTLESDIILGDNITYGSDSIESFKHCLQCANLLMGKSANAETTIIPTTEPPITVKPSGVDSPISLPLIHQNSLRESHKPRNWIKHRNHLANYAPNRRAGHSDTLYDDDYRIPEYAQNYNTRFNRHKYSNNEYVYDVLSHRRFERDTNSETDDKKTSDQLKPSEEIVDIKKPENEYVYDGPLDKYSNYTGFVELIVPTDDKGKMMLIYSDYFPVLKPGPNSDVDPTSNIDLIITVLLIFVIIAFIVLVVLCVIYGRNRRSIRNQGVEMNSLQNTLRNIYQGLKGRRHLLATQTPPDMPPIAKGDLLAAYTERQADSGYGFQQEFEMLPDMFHDRTMDASEAKENQNKNRYPDIKAYDQTRVKLSQIDSIVGSDYINANIVMGYKERKKFICAQGPTDVTIDDFWRMIWENNLDLVVMLTNLEEYSKVKCAKYWPDQNQQDMSFGSINVHHVGEKRYSDYIIRELKVTKQAMSNSNSNHHIIETNGAPKKNGGNEYNNGVAGGANDVRIVHQYHFLMWKDFIAPEHPYAILKFIKRVNEGCSAGRPTLVHCSAGVGRTGTLVALDCLLEQLSAEEQVAVFNTVCDLRRQRNFLVQSLKQYIFIYRCLVEYSKYGDTEIPASRLKSTIDRLRQTAENNDTCPLEEEFELLKQPLLETQKFSTSGRSVEHSAKNRSDSVLPYDNNRVILAPVATKENSTYINASFVEGYDNAESYIIAQDPMASTIADFWRLISEQEVTTIVMLSELGEGKCPRYWDDDEITYDHINVMYLSSESCPYYTRREFQVTNTKNMDRLKVTQLQYHGWPTVSGQVPEVTRGLIELLGQCNISLGSGPPLVVHCNLGTDRSSMFVALSILTLQLRTERRVDVATVTRKLRSQRMGCLDTFLQYEFLHRAILNYAELHNLLSDS